MSLHVMLPFSEQLLKGRGGPRTGLWEGHNPELDFEGHKGPF